jgi:hypothetical protein
MDNINNILDRLEQSKFRNSFHLKDKDIIYVEEKGIDKIRSYAYNFINKRLAPKVILNDGPVVEVVYINGIR